MYGIAGLCIVDSNIIPVILPPGLGGRSGSGKHNGRDLRIDYCSKRLCKPTHNRSVDYNLEDLQPHLHQFLERQLPPEVNTDDNLEVGSC